MALPHLQRDKDMHMLSDRSLSLLATDVLGVGDMSGWSGLAARRTRSGDEIVRA